MKVVPRSYLYGELVAKHEFREEYDSLLSALGSIETPLRPQGDFSSSDRPSRPKRHERTIGGERKPFLLPVDQKALNGRIKKVLRADGWRSEPVAAGELAAALPLGLRGDFVRNKVFVEVEFGN